MPAPVPVPWPDRAEMSVTCLKSITTIGTFLRGDRVTENTARSIVRAAIDLEIDLRLAADHPYAPLAAAMSNVAMGPRLTARARQGGRLT